MNMCFKKDDNVKLERAIMMIDRYSNLADAVHIKNKEGVIKKWWFIRYRKGSAVLRHLGLADYKKEDLEWFFKCHRYLYILCHIEGMLRPAVGYADFLKILNNSFFDTEILKAIDTNVCNWICRIFACYPSQQIVIYDKYKCVKMNPVDMLEELLHVFIFAILCSELAYNLEDKSATRVISMLDTLSTNPKINARYIATTEYIEAEDKFSDFFLRTYTVLFINIVGIPLITWTTHKLVGLNINKVCKMDNLDIELIKFASDWDYIPLECMFATILDNPCSTHLVDRVHIGSFDINQYPNTNKDVYNLLIDIVSAKVKKYKIIKFVSDIKDKDMIALLGKNERIKDTYSVIIAPCSTYNGEDNEEKALAYANTLRVISGVFIKSSPLVLIPSNLSDMFDSSMCAALKSDKLTNRIVIVILSNLNNDTHLTQVDNNIRGADIVLDSTWIKSDKKGGGYSITMEDARTEKSYNEFYNHYDTLASSNFGCYSKYVSGISNLEIKSDYDVDYLNLENTDVNLLINKIKNFILNTGTRVSL